MYNGVLNNIPDMNRKYFTKWHDNDVFLKLYLNDILCYDNEELNSN